MIKKQYQQYFFILFICAVVTDSAHARILTNIFDPYDTLILPQRVSGEEQFTMVLGYEGSLRTHGYMEDETIEGIKFTCAKGNVLQLWQKEQDAIAAFKGFPPTSKIGQYAQMFNINDDNLQHGIYRPCGELDIYANVTAAFQWRFAPQGALTLYVPYRAARLKNVTWKQDPDIPSWENENKPNLLRIIEEVGDLNLHGWNRHGFGDLTLQASGAGDFLQTKQWLRNVRIQGRGGLIFPTGKKEDIDKLVAFPFGNDGGWGIIFAGHLELWYVSNTRFGIDCQFTQFFGNTHLRRIKTDPAQTDLFLLKKTNVFSEPGLQQHYTLYLEQAYWFNSGFTAQLAYQYTKNNEDKYYLMCDEYDLTVVNNAESLQEATVHNIIVMGKYEWNRDYFAKLTPALTFYYKHGFNGKRAIVADTLGITFSLSF